MIAKLFCPNRSMRLPSVLSASLLSHRSSSSLSLSRAPAGCLPGPRRAPSDLGDLAGLTAMSVIPAVLTAELLQRRDLTS